MWKADIQSEALQHNRKVVQDLNQLARALTANSDELKHIEILIAEEGAELARPLTPVISGSLARSHGILIENDDTFIGIAPDAVNPFSPEKPAEYGPKVHEMGGLSRSGHVRAFYDVLIEQHGEHLADVGEEAIDIQLDILKS